MRCGSKGDGGRDGGVPGAATALRGFEEEEEGGGGGGRGRIRIRKRMGMGMGESVVVPAPRFGVLKKKKMLEVERFEPPPPQPTFDAPRFGVLKKRKVPKPARPNLVLATGRQAAGLMFRIRVFVG